MSDGAREAGETLVELLVSITIIGTVVVAVVGALSSVAANAHGQRTDARAQAVIARYAERVRATPLIPCATPAEYDARLVDDPGPERYAATVQRVWWWDGTAFRADASTLDATVLPAATTIDLATPFAGGAPATPFEIKVGSGPAPEPMTVTDVSGTRLTVVRGDPLRQHDPAASVTRCPPSDSRHNLQRVDVAVAGPPVGVGGGVGPYAATLSIGKRGPLLVSQLTPVDGVVPERAVAGDELGDAALLSYAGASAPDGVAPTGTIAFKLFAPGDELCSGPPVFESTVQVTGFGQHESARRATFLDAAAAALPPPRLYRWTATYGGDAAFQGASTVCDAPGQAVELAPATPTLAIAAPPTATAGDAGSATATLAGGVGPDPDGADGEQPAGPRGTIAFALHGPLDPDCTSEPLYEAGAPVAGNGAHALPAAPPDPPTLAVAGTYRWIARYLGDDNNEPAAVACADAAAVAVSEPPRPEEPGP